MIIDSEDRKPVGRVEVKRRIDADDVLRSLFSIAVGRELLEDARAIEMGYFRELPPHVDRYMTDLQETLSNELAVGLLDISTEKVEILERKLSMLQKSMAEANVMGWMMAEFETYKEPIHFETFAEFYLESHLT